MRNVLIHLPPQYSPQSLREILVDDLDQNEEKAPGGNDLPEPTSPRQLLSRHGRGHLDRSGASSAAPQWQAHAENPFVQPNVNLVRDPHSKIKTLHASDDSFQPVEIAV